MDSAHRSLCKYSRSLKGEICNSNFFKPNSCRASTSSTLNAFNFYKTEIDDIFAGIALISTFLYFFGEKESDYLTD
ncbi:MAG: hypothetical protein C0397_01260 [Odoribacter sp.]|nr:hypothetical protein [Odoribacter sp.]